MIVRLAWKRKAASKKLAAAWRARPINHIFFTSFTKQNKILVITTIQIYEARVRIKQLSATQSVQNLLRKQPRKMTQTTLPVQCLTSIMEMPMRVLPLISLLQKYSLREQSVLARDYLIAFSSLFDYYYSIISMKQAFTSYSSKLHLIEQESTPSQHSTRLRLSDTTDKIAGKLATSIHILFQLGIVPLEESEMRAWQKGPSLPRAVVSEPKKYLFCSGIKEIEQGTAFERRIDRETPIIILPTKRATVFLDRIMAMPMIFITWPILMLFSLPSFSKSREEIPSWKKMPVTNMRELLRLQQVEALAQSQEKIREEIEEI